MPGDDNPAAAAAAAGSGADSSMSDKAAGSSKSCASAPAPPPAPTTPTVKKADLPQEAQDTIQLIDDGGPFPYPKKDGSTFNNRDDDLPTKPKGYYKEYTVPTPGAKNRGAQRIVTGKDGEMYYTDNHYASFSKIV